jgi:virulence factor Mce-like protein
VTAWWKALRGWLAAGLGAVVVVSGIIVLVRGGPPMRQVTAHFASAPGLYAGNQVDVLGIPIGRVTKVTPNATGVEVRFVVPTSLPLPDQVHVVLMAPSVVSDRYLQLSPAYKGGPRLADPAVIPMDRTAFPVSVDQILSTIDELAKALGPSGANATGALSEFLHNSAQAFGSDGTSLHNTITSFGQALSALSSHGPDLTALLTSLGNLTHVASQSVATYQSFANDLASVSSSLAADNADVGAALSALQQALGQLASFAASDGASLGASVTNLQSFAATVAQQAANLAKVFGVLPVALQNLNNAYNPNTPGGPSLTARYDPLAGSPAFGTAVCGNSLLRLLTVALATPQNPDNKPGDDLICGLNGVLERLPVPPGASAGPNLTISALVGGR